MTPVTTAPAASAKGPVMLIQQGARRNYAYAQQLEKAGLLHSLVTDAAWTPETAGSLTRLLCRARPALKGPLARRTVLDIPREKLKASIIPNLLRPAMVWAPAEQKFAFADEALAWRSRIRGLDGARIIVNYHGNGGSYLDYAKARGAKIVTDFIITPNYLSIENAERESWPGWEVQWASDRIIRSYRQRMAWLLRVSDLYLCPSQTVARDLADFPAFDPARMRLVPYGISGVLLHPPQPATGRVLFAGAAGLRKGLPYLAQAATILKQRRPEIEIAVAGEITPQIRSRPEARGLTFLGSLNREAMADEFARADLFCLPSLAEGSATAIFEAMANGLPTVTTSSSGSMVEHGVEGLIVPERDGLAIADAIERIAGDRPLRSAMSEAALAASNRYNDEACGRRFIEVVRELAT
jgi:glycosyltransferase involved in cell wall biosynthesis